MVPSGKADAWAFEAAAEDSDMLVAASILNKSYQGWTQKEKKREKRCRQNESEKRLL